MAGLEMAMADMAIMVDLWGMSRWPAAAQSAATALFVAARLAAATRLAGITVAAAILVAAVAIMAAATRATKSLGAKRPTVALTF